MPGEGLTTEERDLLREITASVDRGAFAMACDGSARPVAGRLRRGGLVDWKGESWGSSFFAPSAAGRAALATPPQDRAEEGRR